MTFTPTLRLTKGSRLTFQEMDDNFQGLADAIGDNSSIGAVTLEQFNPSAGTGGDDTLAWQSACAESVATGKGIQLLAKTYRIKAQREDELKWTFKSFLRGVSGSKIVSLDLEPKQPEGNYKTTLPLVVDGVEISDFELDGNISADPISWATDYDNFAGSRGLVFSNSANVTVRNVVTNNTMWAGIAAYVIENALIERCRTNRCRGNFGDGYYFMGAKNVLVNNCYTYDFTRIGYVLESNTAQVVSTRGVLFNNCYAEFGHDCSALYGGIEGNYGFWFENFVNATCVNCRSKNMNRSTGGGFKSVVSFWPSHAPSIEGLLYANNTYINCVAEECRYGFDVNSIQEDMRNKCKIQSCSAIGVQIGLFVGQRPTYQSLNDVHVEDFFVYIDDHNSATRGIMHNGGLLTVKNMRLKFSDGFDQVAWDNEADGYSAIGAFSTNAPELAVLEDVKVFLIDDTEIPVNFKYRSSQTRANTELIVKDCWVKTRIMNVKSLKYVDCTVAAIGTEEGDLFTTYENCKILDSRSADRPVAAYQNQIKPVTFLNCEFDFVASGAELYAFINTGRVKKEPAFLFQNCIFKKDVEVDGRMIRLNAETTLKNDNNDIFNYVFNNCQFINAGGATTNPIIFTDGIDVDHFTALGSGNLKSETLTVNGNSTLVPYFNPAPFGLAKPAGIAVTTSRDLISNDFMRTLTNLTASAYVLTLTASGNNTAPIGTEITLTKLGTGNISFTPTAPTTVNGTTTFAVTTQYSSRTIRKVGADAWVTV